MLKQKLFTQLRNNEGFIFNNTVYIIDFYSRFNDTMLVSSNGEYMAASDVAGLHEFAEVNVIIHEPIRMKLYTVYQDEYGLYHREDGPAIELKSGHKEWYIDGRFHRLDGPAVEAADGTKKWYVDGYEYDNELEYWIAVQKYINEYQTGLTT